MRIADCGLRIADCQKALESAIRNPQSEMGVDVPGKILFRLILWELSKVFVLSVTSAL